MRLLATFGLILICCYARAIETDGYRAHQETYSDFSGALEKVKDLLRTGNETLGIPPLDPFISETLPINLDIEHTIKLNALFKDVDVRGLTSYNVNKADFDLFGMKLVADITIMKMFGSLGYNMSGSIGDTIPLFGAGDINLALEELRVAVEVAFSLNGVYLKVKTLGTDFGLKSLIFKITGLFNDEETSEMLSAIISDAVPGLLEHFKTEIKDFVDPAVTDLVDNFLADKTLSDLWELINGFN